MATPAYQGQGQPSADNGSGLFGRLGSFFGNGGTPSYAGVGQPTTGGAGYLGGSAVAYAPAPAASKPEISSPEVAASSDADAEVMCPIDSEALASGAHRDRHPARAPRAVHREAVAVAVTN